MNNLVPAEAPLGSASKLAIVGGKCYTATESFQVNLYANFKGSEVSMVVINWFGRG